MVWLHGGDFRATSANFPSTDGLRFAQEQNTVVVALNYRLGPFGFLAHNALTLEDPGYASSGNYGLADQRAALRWVRDNIAAFGGDPANVTLFGQSAGAVSTSLHLVSPASRGLFQRAILQSGQASARWTTTAEAEAAGDAFAARIGCTDRTRVVACMRSATADQVPRGASGRAATIPRAAGCRSLGASRRRRRGSGSAARVVPAWPVQPDAHHRWRRGRRRLGLCGSKLSERSGCVAIRASGSNWSSAWTQTRFCVSTPPTSFPTPKDALARLTGDAEVVCEARRVARVLHHDGAPVYIYSFEYIVDAVTPGRAFHGLDLNFVFGNNFAAPSNHALTVGTCRCSARSARSGRVSPRPAIPILAVSRCSGRRTARCYGGALGTADSDQHFVFG